MFIDYVINKHEVLLFLRGVVYYCIGCARLEGLFYCAELHWQAKLGHSTKLMHQGGQGWLARHLPPPTCLLLAPPSGKIFNWAISSPYPGV